MLIQIVAPNPSWPDAFARIRTVLLPALPTQVLIHQIGSTAVPGLVAKDVIDIQVTVPKLAAFEPDRLARAGFERRPPTADHCPPGQTLPAPELAKVMFRATRPVLAHIDIREAGRFNQRYALLCRDDLRAHTLAAAAYGAIKLNLALRFPNDIQAYYAIKDPVFDLLMAGAEAWAAASNWTEPGPD